MMFCLITRCWKNRKLGSSVQLHQFLEGFAGQAMVSLHLTLRGLTGKRLDLEYSNEHDIVGTSSCA